MAVSSQRPSYALAIALIVLAVVGCFFYRGQNVSGHVGGAISVPKIFWLTNALAVFFVLPGYFWRDVRLDPALRYIFGCQFLNWVVRGIGELGLMYGLHAWIPPYGIYHGLFTLGMLLTLRIRYHDVLATAGTPVDQNAKRFLFFSMLTSLCEICFALMFYMAANFDTRTTWFANGSPAFVRINRITSVVDVFAYFALAVTVHRYYRPKLLGRRRLKTSP
jgi:hypothetical protein